MSKRIFKAVLMVVIAIAVGVAGVYAYESSLDIDGYLRVFSGTPPSSPTPNSGDIIASGTVTANTAVITTSLSAANIAADTANFDGPVRVFTGTYPEWWDEDNWPDAGNLLVQGGVGAFMLGATYSIVSLGDIMCLNEVYATNSIRTDGHVSGPYYIATSDATAGSWNFAQLNETALWMTTDNDQIKLYEGDDAIFMQKGKTSSPSEPGTMPSPLEAQAIPNLRKGILRLLPSMRPVRAM